MKSSRKIIAAVIATGVMGVGALAVAAPPGNGDCGMRQTSMRGNIDPAAMAERRLSRLKTDLKITAEQEPLWQSFAQTIKDEAGKGMAVMRDQAKDTTLPAPERMSRMTELMKQRVTAMESVNASFNQLYEGLSPEQRKLADEQAARFGPMGMGHDGRFGRQGRGDRRGPPPASTNG